MRKLESINVGKTFNCISEELGLIVHYKIIDESFAHAFGTQIQFSYEVESVTRFDAKLDRWVEISDEQYAKQEKSIKDLVEKDL